MASNNMRVHILDGSLWRNIPKFALPVAATTILAMSGIMNVILNLVFMMVHPLSFGITAGLILILLL